MQLAEQTGVVHAVGLWWLHTAADQARSWRQAAGDAVPPVAVTLTSSQAQDPDLVAKVPLPAMRTVTGAPAGEVGADAEDNLRVLTEMGVRTALHDFACGAGELACLPELPVHAVRIAPLAAQRVADDVSAIPAQVLRAVMPMVRSAGISVVACEVDTEEQADWWRGVGADRGVGALFGQPRTTTVRRADARFARRHLVRAVHLSSAPTGKRRGATGRVPLRPASGPGSRGGSGRATPINIGREMNAKRISARLIVSTAAVGAMMSVAAPAWALTGDALTGDALTGDALTGDALTEASENMVQGVEDHPACEAVRESGQGGLTLMNFEVIGNPCFGP